MAVLPFVPAALEALAEAIIFVLSAMGIGKGISDEINKARQDADDQFSDQAPSGCQSCLQQTKTADQEGAEASDAGVGDQPIAGTGTQTAGSRGKGRDNITEERAGHILNGDAKGRGGGHRAGTGKPGKTEFPADWSDDKILDSVSDVAKNGTPVKPGNKPNTTVKTGTVDGVDIEVVVNNGDGSVVTGYPVKGPGVVKNPFETPAPGKAP